MPWCMTSSLLSITWWNIVVLCLSLPLKKKRPSLFAILLFTLKFSGIYNLFTFEVKLDLGFSISLYTMAHKYGHLLFCCQNVRDMGEYLNKIILWNLNHLLMLQTWSWYLRFYYPPFDQPHKNLVEPITPYLGVIQLIRDTFFRPPPPCDIFHVLITDF